MPASIVARSISLSLTNITMKNCAPWKDKKVIPITKELLHGLNSSSSNLGLASSRPSNKDRLCHRRSQPFSNNHLPFDRATQVTWTRCKTSSPVKISNRSSKMREEVLRRPPVGLVCMSSNSKEELKTTQELKLSSSLKDIRTILTYLMAGVRPHSLLTIKPSNRIRDNNTKHSRRSHISKAINRILILLRTLLWFPSRIALRSEKNLGSRMKRIN